MVIYLESENSRIGLVLPIWLILKLKKLAKAKGTTVSGLIKHAIVEFYKLELEDN